MTVDNDLQFELIGRDLFEMALQAHDSESSYERKTRGQKEAIVLSVVQHALDMGRLRDDADDITEDQWRAIDHGISLALEQWLYSPTDRLEASV